MKSIKDYLAQDMWGHIMMSSDAIRGCVTMTTCKTKEEQKKYCQGMMTVFPHMLLSNFDRWYFGDSGRDFKKFMDTSVEHLQERVFPILEQYFLENNPLSEHERGELLIPVITDEIPKYVLNGYYQFAFNTLKKDISAFWETVDPFLTASAKALEVAYLSDTTISERSEIFLYAGTIFPFALIKRWYDWMFGKEKMEFPAGNGPQG